MPKILRVAGEVDGWCTKCRFVLNHRIVSLKNGKAHQVECLTCRTQHLWRPNAPGQKSAAPSGSGRSEGSPSAAPRAKATRGTRVTPTMLREQQWEKAILGHAVNEFKSYAVGGSFREGDLLRHKKFGEGVVTRVIDTHKVEVLFRDEARTLAQSMS
jgi:hypothetical protein